MFDQAKQSVTPHLIEAMLPGGVWRGKEYWVQSPLRADRKPGSFHIAESGKWYDHATSQGGSFIDLMSEEWGVPPKEAAERLLREQGEYSPPTRETPKPKPREKVAPLMPVPITLVRRLSYLYQEAWCQERYGIYQEAYGYRDQEGQLLYVRVRFEREENKNVIPFYCGKDQKWHAGEPPGLETLPLFGLQDLQEARPVLLVEGERCVVRGRRASTAYTCITFGGGTKAIGKHDFSPLQDRRVIYWPDADALKDNQGGLLPLEKQPGYQAAMTIKQRLPHVEILDVWHLAKKKSGYDLADFLEEEQGTLEVFVRETPRFIPPPTRESRPKEPAPAPVKKLPAPTQEAEEPYRALGWDEENCYFLDTRRSVIRSIASGEFTTSKLISLAPLGYWESLSLSTPSGGLRVAAIQSKLEEECRQAGCFDREKVRGGGVWRDGKALVINSRGQCITAEGRVPEDPSAFTYVFSRARFSALGETATTAAEGESLRELFEAQGFTQKGMADLLMGWTLLAPFAGVLDWRPHLWLTARRGTGKTYVIENLLQPLLGDFRHDASAMDTPAGLFRRLNNHAMPVLMDEACGDRETKTSLENFLRILRLARNASSDASATRTIARGKDGTMEFLVRSMFLFSSISMIEAGAGVDSRIVPIELDSRADIMTKQNLTRQNFSIIRQAPRFRRRIFERLEEILREIPLMEELILNVLPDLRTAQQYAPILTAAWRVRSDEPVSLECEALLEWLGPLLETIGGIVSHSSSDENDAVETLLQQQLQTDGATRVSVSELLGDAAKIDPSDPDRLSADKILQRFGVKIFKKRGVDTLYLAISVRSREMAKALQNTEVESRYDLFIRRNELCLNGEGHGHMLRMAGMRVRARLFAWKDFAQKYLGISVAEEPPADDPPPPRDELPPSRMGPAPTQNERSPATPRRGPPTSSRRKKIGLITRESLREPPSQQPDTHTQSLFKGEVGGL